MTGHGNIRVSVKLFTTILCNFDHRGIAAVLAGTAQTGPLFNLIKI